VLEREDEEVVILPHEIREGLSVQERAELVFGTLRKLFFDGLEELK
jgi:hypothetical protein